MKFSNKTFHKFVKGGNLYDERFNLISGKKPPQFNLKVCKKNNCNSGRCVLFIYRREIEGGDYFSPIKDECPYFKEHLILNKLEEI